MKSRNQNIEYTTYRYFTGVIDGLVVGNLQVKLSLG